jgi:hypothetical protein
MRSVFTNYLSPYYDAGLLPEVDQNKPSKIYEQLRIAYNQGADVLDTLRMFSPLTEDEDLYDIYYAVQNPLLKYWLHWVNRKITLQIGLHSYQTLGVRLRIATSMLNDLVDKGAVKTSIAAKMHANLCDNTWNENNLITNEDLPF